MQEVSRVLTRWGVGFVVATALMWVGSTYFVESTRVYSWEPELDEFVPTPGSTLRARKEGCATTTFGRYRVAALPDFTQIDAPKIALWGDSYVESLQLPNELKPAQQVTSLWREREGTPLVCVGIGFGGWSVADYHARIPRYEQLATFEAHYILLPDMKDVLPDGVKFRTEPEYALQTKAPRSLQALGLRNFVYTYQLDFIWQAAFKLVVDEQNSRFKTLRFRPGPVVNQNAARTFLADTSVPPPKDAWIYLIEAMQSVAKAPIVYVYAPSVPWIEKGVVHNVDREDEYAEVFARLCRERGIRFLNLGDAFRKLYAEERILPRGFPNGKPGTGHLNLRGQRLVAESICADFRSHGHAVHAR